MKMLVRIIEKWKEKLELARKLTGDDKIEK